ncbi:Cytochrome c oxidase subunit 1, partial [Atta colombica]
EDWTVSSDDMEAGAQRGVIRYVVTRCLHSENPGIVVINKGRKASHRKSAMVSERDQMNGWIDSPHDTLWKFTFFDHLEVYILILSKFNLISHIAINEIGKEETFDSLDII